MLVEHRGRRRMAKPEAIDRFERHAGINRGLAQCDAELLLGARSEGIAAGRLTGFGATELQHAASRRFLAEIMIEGDGAVYFGPREIEGLSHERHGRLRHAAEGLLQGMQNWQGCALR